MQAFEHGRSSYRVMQLPANVLHAESRGLSGSSGSRDEACDVEDRSYHAKQVDVVVYSRFNLNPTVDSKEDN